MTSRVFFSLATATFLVLGGVGAASCSLLEKQEEASPATGDTLVFGSFYGMCLGEKCIEIYQLNPTAQTLAEDTHDTYPSSTELYQGSFVRRSAADFDVAKDLPSLIPAQLLDEPNGRIGDPDASDRGGYYVELTHNGQRRFWLIDTQQQNIPAYLHPLTTALSARLQQLP